MAESEYLTHCQPAKWHDPTPVVSRIVREIDEALRVADAEGRHIPCWFVGSDTINDLANEIGLRSHFSPPYIMQIAGLRIVQRDPDPERAAREIREQEAMYGLE